MYKTSGSISIKKEIKIRGLFFKIIAVSIIFILLFIGLIIIADLLLNKKDIFVKQINILSAQDSNLKNEIKSIENKTIIAKKYIESWNKDFLPKQKEFSGINIIEIQQKLKEMSLIYHFNNFNINFSPVSLLPDTTENNKIKVYTALVSVKFNAITDIDIFNFISSLEKKLGYFIIIQEINLERNEKIDDKFLKALAAGNTVSAVKTEIKFRLYGLSS